MLRNLSSAPTNAQIVVDPTNPANSQFSRGIRVFDSQGIGHDLTVYFSKIDPLTVTPVLPTGVPTWQYKVIAPYDEIVRTTAIAEDLVAGNSLVAEGILAFNPSGFLDIERPVLFSYPNYSIFQWCRSFAYFF